MLAIAARRMGYRVSTFSPERNSPTGQIADIEWVAEYNDLEAIRRFASSVDVLTFEFENVSSLALEAAEAIVPIRPGRDVLYTTQNRLREKKFLADAGIPVAPFRSIASADDLKQAAQDLGLPAILKTAGFGYDGKGQQRLNIPEEIDRAFAGLGGQEGILEAFVDFSCEISVVAARGLDGSFAHYGAVENIHKNHILATTIAPARIPEKLQAQAVELTRETLSKLNVIGVLCVEMFVTKHGELVVNELAPRPHNSGHFTVDANITNQFEQQLRAVCGLPLGSTEQLRPAVMMNLLGDLWAHGTPDWEAALSDPNVKLHLYGKAEARPGRKMGHVTALGNTIEEAQDSASRAYSALIHSA
jgi:5-(carboxyamino)imidazole ribonucleotide synthase